MVPWSERPSITLEESRPWKERLAGVPPEAIASGKDLLDAVLKEVPAAARYLADAVRLRTAGRFQTEAVHMAQMAGVSWRDVLIASITYDLVLATFGCSTVALATPTGPVLARNMDWWPEDLLARASYLIDVKNQGQTRFVSAGWPGAIGVVTGLSSKGFGVALNAVLGPERWSLRGYPVMLHLRRVLEDAADFEQALAMLTKQALAAPALFTLVGRENRERVVIERSPRRFALRWPRGDEALVTTNDYRSLFAPETHAGLEIYQTTCSRYEALTDFLGQNPGQNADDALLYILSSAAVKQTITAQHVILRPRTNAIRLFVPRNLL